MKMAEAICCTLLNCNCDNFKPGKQKRRQCENCKHGWVAHALSKLKVQDMYQHGQVEIVHTNVVFDICSLMLYGTQAIPIRLKILLDRLLSVLKQEEVITILNALDWTLQDYIRGYVLQDVAGKVLDRWAIMTFEEEIATLQQFLRFGSCQQLHEQHQESCQGSVKHQSQRQGDQAQDKIANEKIQQIPSSADSSHIGTNSVTFTALQDNKVECLSSTTKIEVGDFSTSDNYSDAPPPPSMISDVIQMSAFGRMRNGHTGLGISIGSRGGGALKKGRVFCNACEKTFYDKGTLKIHYNAVHLKIKHKCTIEGCNMVFSSLRSRNRHSANPNPRLHMSLNRNNRQKYIQDILSSEEYYPGEKMSEQVTSIPTCSAKRHRSLYSYTVEQVDSGLKIHKSSFPSTGQRGILFPNLKTVQPVLPFYRSLVTPAEIVHATGILPSLPLLSPSVSVKHTTVHDICNADPIPKKKSRKSSMPIKIEKGMLEQNEQTNKGTNFEKNIPLLDPDKEARSCHRAKQEIIFMGAEFEHEEKEIYFYEAQERKGKKYLSDQTIEKHKDDTIQQVKTVTTISSSSSLKNTLIKSLCNNQLDSQELSFNRWQRV
ncbi:zinc finger protein basonuclin-1 isoform X2 [Syngnathus scovelli]|uniref:zinc finger protein basonuclin-1 isoform X2 n=1 Tax=Syngnathus scovelli TaxID=161590 RepID=UPI0021103C09|nr:zinc finger protein basonuclin-1 isoform X2 [Syngnathus scovelli]